ncbi:hypothetical protein EW026_g5975 [Hermanssonia centrifuga]|uniref:3-oxo-5-alpha-steroid 4-dehydrogenase C-terminal domain-containing protein n=1 Tax=Hermanssonia centrifuga TaxID=98765 RepID=A0A4V3X9W5_9APHY|nr:hypothetical protein EW026_g5975 [Hermanssonia centrifuga]
MVQVTISASGRKSSLASDLPVVLDIPAGLDSATVEDVKAAFAAKQKLTLKDEKKSLADDTTLQNAGFVDGGELQIKDLGPQISWRTVFIVEYVGPLIIHPLMYHFPKVFYGGSVQHSLLQHYVYAMVMLHFFKREFETVFVHRFSHGTMPFAYIFRNSAHYHLLGGLGLAYAVYSPTYSSSSPYIRGTIRDDPKFLWACTAIWLFCELSNLKTHVILRNLRPVGTKKRAIPYGYGFNLVSTPNYFFEIVGWIVVCLMTGSYASWVFTATGIYFMGTWAMKKHRNYKKEFGKEYPRRKIMIPFIF